jgi:hypothetical protein
MEDRRKEGRKEGKRIKRKKKIYVRNKEKRVRRYQGSVCDGSGRPHALRAVNERRRKSRRGDKDKVY